MMHAENLLTTTYSWQLTCTLPIDVADDASAMLIDAGALGVQILDTKATHDTCVLLASYDAAFATNVDTLVQGAISALHNIGIVIETQDISAKQHLNQDWSETWKQHFKPMKIGRKLWIIPSWEKLFIPPSGSIILQLDPGMAFGTGQHATTALCLRAIERFAPQTSLLDVGCGTGILGIAAAKLGYKHVDAIDNDPLATQAAQENIDNNHVKHTMHVSICDISVLTHRYHIIVANILANVLADMAEHIWRRLAPNGIMILSGILTSQMDETFRAFESAAIKLGLSGIQKIERSTHKEWAALILYT